MADYNYFTKLKMTQSSGWKLQRKHWQNEMKWSDVYGNQTGEG